MIRLKRILIPTDFSDCSKRAQEYACALAEQFQAELHVLHVLVDVALMMPEPGSMAMMPQNYLLELKQTAEKALEGLLAPSWTQGRRVVRATRMGNPFVEISKYASERDIDLIVIGTH